MLTTRDTEVIEFIREYKAATTETIAEIMFPSLSACQKRLKVLHESKQISRIRDNINSQYVYFVKQPKQFRHTILVTDFYRELHKRSDVVGFKCEPVLGDIRPDAVFGYRESGMGFVGLLEVEISNKGFDSGKYNKFYAEDYRKYFPVPPTLFIISDTVKPFLSNYSAHLIDTQFKNMRLDNVTKVSVWASA